MSYGRGSGQYNLAYMGLDQLGCPGLQQLNGGPVKKSAATGAAITTGVISTATAVVGTTAVTAAVTAAATAVGASAATGAAIGTAIPIPIVGTAIGLVIGAAVGLIINAAGGVKQDRFIDRYFEVKGILNKAGYTMSDKEHDALITKLKIRKTQVANKKKKGSYAPEFARLMEYVVIRLEKFNPGLGLYWASNFPMSMENKGNIKGGSVSKLKALANMFKPGTYKGQQPFATDADGKLLKTITTGGKTMIGAEGETVIDNIPRDPKGNAVLPKEVINEASKIQVKAGIGKAAGVMLLLTIAGVAISSQKQKQAA